MAIELRDEIISTLRRSPGLTARKIADGIFSNGSLKIHKVSVNRCLYGNPLIFRRSDDLRPRWHLIGESDSSVQLGTLLEGLAISASAQGIEALQLYAWQTRALDEWAKQGYVGIIEAVTGAGKTRLALAAIESELRRGGRTVVIVPTIELQNQWKIEIQKHLLEGAGIRATVGLLGGGSEASLDAVDILITTVQSASKYQLSSGVSGLLVADEVHHYGAQVWTRALEPGFDRRLGLTATYERDDDGLEAFLTPYFGGVRYRLGYQEALGDDVIAHFKIAFVGVRFNLSEQEAYNDQDDKARKRRKTLINEFGLTPEPFGVFMREVQQLSKSGDEGSKAAGLYLSAFSKRRQMLAAATQKYDYLPNLAHAVRAANATIIFSQTREAAERSVAAFEEVGMFGATLHAELDPSERQETFDDFRHGNLQVIAAPKLLDEGVNVPDADLAIVLACSRSKRQMIQRMGRIIRKKPDGRLGRLAILYVEGTSEDPSSGAHEGFIDFVLEAADEVACFESGTDPQDVVAYLDDWF